MNLALQIMLGLGAGGPAKTYIEDVFSAFTYTGNGATQTITNGIDLAGKGGLIWGKNRDVANSHWLLDTARGNTSVLVTNTTAAAVAVSAADYIPSFDSAGFHTGPFANDSGNNIVTWTFRKAPKFFDVVTWTGTGVNRTIAHSLGQVPGMIAVKRTDTTGDWQVYHRSIANTEFVLLDTADAKATDATKWNSATATASVFSLGTHVDVNASGGTYVAYVFAHDTSADGLIQCGSFTTDGSGKASVTLGWEPQLVLMKITGFDYWRLADTSRGMSLTKCLVLNPNRSAAEADAFGAFDTLPNATGFTATQAVSSTYIYMAIRRPMKTPTSGAQVFKAIARTGTGATAEATGVGFPSDLVMTQCRDLAIGEAHYDRLRGRGMELDTSTTSAEGNRNADTLSAFNMDGFSLGFDPSSGVNASGLSYIHWCFRRAPGFFDEVCYTGTGVAHTEAHGLGAVPQLVIVKCRSAVSLWQTYAAAIGAGSSLDLHTTGIPAADATVWNNTTPTASVFSLGTSGSVNSSGNTFVAYLFATLAGVSKVGSYTGNGTSQTIACGFAAGARFILIKRTDAVGDWFVWDTVRGVVAGSDPHLSLNTTAAEVTTDDSIDPDASGFIVNQLAATNINVNAATYIFLAIS